MTTDDSISLSEGCGCGAEFELALSYNEGVGADVLSRLAAQWRTEHKHDAAFEARRTHQVKIETPEEARQTDRWRVVCTCGWRRIVGDHEACVEAKRDHENAVTALLAAGWDQTGMTSKDVNDATD